MKTEYVKKRDQLKRANFRWGIFLPVWLISWVFTLLLSEELANNHATLSIAFKWLAILAGISFIPMFLYTWKQIKPYYGPWAKCESCGADAIVWKVLGDKWSDLGRKYFDECPNCGNDNTEAKT